MYREFGITKISTSLAERKIVIEFSLDVDPDTLSQKTLAVLEKDTGTIVSFSIKSNRNIVELHMRDWPVAESEYIIRIQSGILSIVEDPLPDSLQRTVTFKSEVTSAIEIISPAYHEEVEKLFFSWNELSADNLESSLVYFYYLEIAKENAFYNIVRKSEIKEQQSVLIANIEPGQYYARIRAQKGAQYGKWSEVVTFVVVEPEEPEEEPIFEDELLIVSSPFHGETPSSFLIEFDSELDTGEEYEFTVTRRAI